jgi:hypothetical protein
VRVFWPRDPSNVVTNDCQDGTRTTVDNVSKALGNAALNSDGNGAYHVVTQAGAVRQP